MSRENLDHPQEGSFRKFDILPCDDSDLLHISSMIEHSGSHFVAVGTCLLIDQKTIATVDKDHLCPMVDKLNKILTKWKLRNKTNATSSMLIKRLQVLGDEKLTENVQAYFSKKNFSSSGMLCILHK